MTDKNSAASPNPDENSGHRHLERVVDELRTVLSDLGRSPKRTDKAEENFVEKKEAPRAPAERVFSEPPPNPFQATSSHPAPSEPVSSDADFWNGNVLGWPNGEAENGNGHSNGKRDDEPINGVPEEPTEEEMIRSLGIKSEALIMRDPVDAINMEESDPTLSDARMDLGPSPFGPAPAELSNEWTAEEPVFSEAELPDAPKSPLEIFPPIGAPTNEPEPISSNPFAPTFSAFHEEKPSAPPPQPAIEPSAVPIPQTIHKKPEIPKTNVPNLNLDEPEARPQGHVQIACIYPEGQEKMGQAFVNKLREVGEKSKKGLNIQAVFVHPWTSDKVDIAAWKKSAVLSGADLMFVLVTKANAASLKNLSGNDPLNPIKSRIVYLEQIPLRTLYADIVVELQRGK